MQQSKPIVALTGASGGIGRTLLPALLEQFQVRALFRSRGKSLEAAEAMGAQVVLGSLDDQASLTALVEGCTAVIHSAASVVRELSSAQKTNVEGTMRLAECGASAGCKRFVHLSTIAVYLGNKGRSGVFTEDLPLVENWRMDQYSRTKLRAELELAKFARTHAMEIVVVRPTCVYGPGIDAWTKMPLKLIRKGLPMMTGSGQGHIDVVHADDVVQAILLATTHPAAAGQTFNLGHRSLPTREFLGYYSRMLCKRLRGIPRPVVKAVLNGGGAIERVAPLGLMANVSPNRLRLLEFCTSGVAGKPKFPSTKLCTLLGYQPQVNLSAGMLQTQEWAQQRGLLKKRRSFQHEECNYAFTPQSTFFPECEADIQQIVNSAAARGLGVRAVGSIHSMVPLPATKAVCLSPQRMRGLVSVDGMLATVQPGTRLCDLNDALAEHGLALPALGAITKQTIAGVISTGTHGGSAHHGSVSSAVERLRMVTADGNAIQLHRSDERFCGAALSLGLMGVISEVTLRCVKAFCLRSEVRVMSFDQMLEQFNQLQQENEYCDINWYPLAERVEVMTCRRVEGTVPNRQIKPGKAPGANGANRWVLERALRKFYRGLWRPLHKRVVNGWVGTWYPEREGRSDYVLAYQNYKPSRMPVTDMDMAVPMAHACDALRAVRQSFVDHNKFPVLGMRVRTQSEEPFWLSGSFGGPACWIESFHSMPAVKYVERMHNVLAPFNYRPHWGKTVHADPAYWASVYPRWQQFHQLRRQLDPTGMFANDYMRSTGFLGDAASGSDERIAHAPRAGLV